MANLLKWGVVSVVGAVILSVALTSAHCACVSVEQPVYWEVADPIVSDIARAQVEYHGSHGRYARHQRHLSVRIPPGYSVEVLEAGRDRYRMVVGGPQLRVWVSRVPADGREVIVVWGRRPEGDWRLLRELPPAARPAEPDASDTIPVPPGPRARDVSPPGRDAQLGRPARP